MVSKLRCSPRSSAARRIGNAYTVCDPNNHLDVITRETGCMEIPVWIACMVSTSPLSRRQIPDDEPAKG